MNFEKTISISRKKDKLFMIQNGWPIDLSAPEFVEINLPPNVKPISKFLNKASELKQIKEDFVITIKNDWFLFCDAHLKFKDRIFNGLIYDVESEKIKLEYDRVWICQYIDKFFEKIPENIYLEMEQM